MRYFKATVEYDGTDFAGFQIQRDARTVQGELERSITSLTGQSIHVTGAGRTDSGVHALGQVVSFGIETSIPAGRMAPAWNSVLPVDISIRRADEVSASFNARYSASSRLYWYVIWNSRIPSALMRRYSASCRVPLDVSSMRAGAALLIGEQDFAAFASELMPGRSTGREVMYCKVDQWRGIVVVRIRANAFLRGMARTIAGTLMQVGLGKLAPSDIGAIIASRDRKRAGPSAPPQGLWLLQVRYGRRKIYEPSATIER